MPQELAQLIRSLLQPPMDGVLPIGSPLSTSLLWPVALVSGMRSITSSLRHPFDGIGVTAPRDWCIMLPLSQRVQPGVYTVMALSRYRDALIRRCPPERPVIYPPLIPEVLTSCFEVRRMLSKWLPSSSRCLP